MTIIFLTVYKTASEILSGSNSGPNASELPSVLSSSEVSSELPSALSSEPATEVQSEKPKAKKVLDKKALAKLFKSNFGNLVAVLRELEVANPKDPNEGIKLRVKSAYEKYLATKIQFIELFKSDAEAEIKKNRPEKKEEMDLVDAYEATKHGGNSEANKQKYMKYKLKYMKLKELLGK